MLSLVGDVRRGELVPQDQRESIDITLTDRVEGSGRDRRLLAIGPDGRLGRWTMVFDEGIEVRLGSKSFFAHFEFELLPGQNASNGDMLDKIGAFYGRADGHELGSFHEKVYGCHCERTSIGWYSVGTSPHLKHGCFFAHRSSTAGELSAKRTVSNSPASLVSLADGRKRVLPGQHRRLRGGRGNRARNLEPGHEAVGTSVFAAVETSPAAELLGLPTTWDWRAQPELSQPGDDLANQFDQGA